MSKVNTDWSGKVPNPDFPKESEHSQMRRQHAQVKKLNAQRSEIYSKKRLISAITKKMKTTMIGAVAACEDALGFLWGHGKPETELTDTELQFLERWEQLRATILDKGNHQLRNAVEEISLNSINFKKYRTDLIISKHYDSQLTKESLGDTNE